MTHLPQTFASAMLLSAAALAPCHAVSTASASVSDSVATSVGSASTSLQGSSNSASGREKVAQGDYQIIAVALEDLPAAHQAGAADGAASKQTARVRLTLQAQAGSAPPLVLLLPQATWAHSGLAAGHTITARHRPYGIEFSRSATQEAFFLVLEDAWQRELQTRPVVL